MSRFILPSSPSPFEPEHLAWSALDRERDLDLAQAGGFDLLILGGGITGAGVAREAALRGIRFLLVDRGDFACGTSSRSSKLVHGGFRYLAQGDWRLVRESCRERNWLQQALPNLVRPAAFHYCARRGGPDTPLRVRAGILLYGLLSDACSRYRNRPGRFLSPAELARREPALDARGVALAGVFHDALVDDARLVLEVLKEARDASGGASVAMNYLQAERIVPGGGGLAVDLTDRLGGRRFTVHSRCVLNATGAWTDATLGLAGLDSDLIRPTKGAHLVVAAERLGIREAALFRAPADGRTCFALRRGEIALIGTTDTDYPGDPARPACAAPDCDYLLAAANRAFPGARLAYGDVLATYAGVRPLLRGRAGQPSALSRRHALVESGPGLVTLAGGKLTTFRPMAWEALAHCCRRGWLRPLRGAEAGREFSRRPFRNGVAWPAWRAAAAGAGLDQVLPPDTLRHLHRQYGMQALRILREARRVPAAGAPLLPGQPFCPAEILHLLAFENAPRLEDVMARRTEMGLRVARRDQAPLAGQVARLMAGYYGWDPAREREEIARYLDLADRPACP